MPPETRTDPSSPRSSTVSDVGRSATRYLFAVWKLSAGRDGRIETGELQEYLDVTAASVTEMVAKLDDRGLADLEKYQGVTLTGDGEAFAARIAWRFCLVSTFFDSVVDTELDEQTALDIAVTLPSDGVSNLRGFVSVPCLGLCPESGGDSEECMA